ncbi:ribosomal protein S27-domain-containing protein [Syncephalastrum racemosum]|uniref:40S ribosomal protein S27 n=1 Tax=Syncephalastrum racemosum TaxID=13706 RepID=A0A1X2H2Z5_SYNRA|nr:ribosomal protein S27-domain-containing protein [Syncephalastrum racemosum]
MTLAVDLLNPSVEHEKRSHKLKRLVQSPNSYFMDVKCPGCLNISTVFSHAQTVVLCSSCGTVLCQPTGGKARLTEGKLLFPQKDQLRNETQTHLFFPVSATMLNFL